jgi:peptidyl-tRNA hydrolase, PTH1 family
MWLVVGLGNPGPQYERTPHNLGFLAVDLLAERHGIRISRREFQALLGEGSFGPEKVILAKPQTFMNLSGQAANGIAARYEIPPERIIAVYDELALPWQALRVSRGGSSAGHNGVKSLIKDLGSPDFLRVRIGIKPDHPIGDAAAFVLAPMRRAQVEELEEVLSHAASAVESIIAEGAEQSMTKHNRRARSA